MIKGIQPGPLLMNEHPDLFWGVVGSMYIGNIMLVIINLPLIPMWVQILRIPYVILFPLIFLLTLIGSYSINNDIWDPAIMIIFGIIGYLMKKFAYEPAPLVMALILGPMFEESLRQSLIISNGSPLIFFLRPISASFLAATVLIFVSPLFLKILRKKRPGISDYE